MVADRPRHAPYSAAIELIQLAIPDRSADIDDVIVNVTGALIGYATLRVARRAVAPSS